MSYPRPNVLPSRGSHLSYRFKFCLSQDKMSYRDHTKCLTEIVICLSQDKLSYRRNGNVLPKGNCLTEMWINIKSIYSVGGQSNQKNIGRQVIYKAYSGLTKKTTQANTSHRSQKPLDIVKPLFFFCNLHSVLRFHYRSSLVISEPVKS